MSKPKFYIQDWAGNACFHGREFESFDDAEEFLSERLGNSYETDREEYDIVQGKLRATNCLDPRDPRAGFKIEGDNE